MGAPKVSSAIWTMSMARTTPAQKPRGLRRRTRLVFVWLPDLSSVTCSRVDVVTPSSIPRQTRREHSFLNQIRCSFVEDKVGLSPEKAESFPAHVHPHSRTFSKAFERRRRGARSPPAG